MNRYSARDVAGFLVALAGFGIIASGLIMNPWVPRIWQGWRIVDKIDVLGSYFAWSLGLGVATALVGLAIPKAPERVLGATLLFFVVTGIILGDRLLLVSFGLPLWKYDVELHYRHRPDTERTFRGRGPKRRIVRINSYGHRGDDFPEIKPADEFRGVLIGDSVTMGYGVTYEETFGGILERLLEERDDRYETYQIINTAVNGYSSHQERRMLEESIRFEPDFVAVGFCMNDVTEPFVIDERLGGTGFDYHGVTQTGNRVRGYLMNETGVGRLLQSLQARSKRLEVAKRRELFSVEQMAQRSLDDPSYAGPWNMVLSELEKMYSISASRDIPIVLLIFPFHVQLLRDDLRQPQAILRQHAMEHGVDMIDFTDIFSRAVYDDPELLSILQGRGLSPEEVQRFYSWRVAQYFLDNDHFMEDGHGLVAKALLDYLISRDLVGAGPAS